MAAQDFAYTRTTNKSPSDAVVALRRAAEAARWTVMGGYDFGEILASKGFSAPTGVRTLQLCAAHHANAMLARDMKTSLFMPCSVSIIGAESETTIAVMQPSSVMPDIFQHAGAELAEHARQIDDELRRIVDEAAG